MKDFFCNGCITNKPLKEFGGKSNNKGYCKCCWPARREAKKKAIAKSLVVDVIAEHKEEAAAETLLKRRGDLTLEREIAKINDYWGSL